MNSIKLRCKVDGLGGEFIDKTTFDYSQVCVCVSQPLAAKESLSCRIFLLKKKRLKANMGAKLLKVPL